MPLPPAPTKRAALLSPAALDAPARTPLKAARKAENREPVTTLPTLELFDTRPETGGEQGAAYSAKTLPGPDTSVSLSYKKQSTLQPKPAVRPKKTATRKA